MANSLPYHDIWGLMDIIEGALDIVKEMWNLLKAYGVVGMALFFSIGLNVAQGRVIWQLLQFLKQYIGKKDAE